MSHCLLEQPSGQNIHLLERRDGNSDRSKAKNIRQTLSVIMNEKEKQALLEKFREFLDQGNCGWYSRRGIPYNLGLLFYGPPGTGTSSFSLSLAGCFDMDIYVVNLLMSLMTPWHAYSGTSLSAASFLGGHRCRGHVAISKHFNRGVWSGRGTLEENGQIPGESVHVRPSQRSRRSAVAGGSSSYHDDEPYRAVGCRSDTTWPH